ncbi:MAG: hypothetical protein J6X01_07290, partial [Bacteroidales bacterium]|nr:hypothetical protein [Bacteroidales bacterium]
MYRPCNGLLGLNCKSVIVAMLTLSALVWGNGLMGQDGTQTHPYPIKDKEALVTLAQCINTGHNFKFENDMFVVDPSGDIPAYGMGTYFQQTDNIDMLNESNWFTIGNSLATGFQGVYLGNGKKIQNLTLTADKPALFCYPNGRIVNLTIENPVFSGTINCGGALATFVMGGTIDSCHVTGHNMVFNGKDCGALIGWVGIPDGEKAGEVTISNCSNSCNITSNYQQESYTDYYNSVAGVVACIRAHRYHVTRCFNTGNIVSTYRPLYQKDMICFAGVVGRGILPYLSSDITYCYNTGDITAHCGYLGGVAGFFDEEVGVTNYTRCTIDYCFNTGDITGIPVLHVDNPTAYIYADTNIDVFSLGGVVAPSKTKTRYCFNTGNVTLRKHPHPRFTINGDQGVAGVGSSAEHCFNVGEITNYNLRNGRAAGVSRDTANHCFNAAGVDDRNPRYTFSPHNIAQVTLNSVSDAQMSVDGQDGNLYSTGKLMGEFSSVKNCLGEEHWIYETGLYPRLKWTDTCAWARDIAIVASTPILLSDTLSDIRHVTSGLQLTGCDKGVVWKAPAGNCLFVNSTLEGETCIDNASFHSIQPAMQSICNDPVTVAATWNGDTIKTITLIRRVAATLDTIPINSLAELKALRDGINTGEAFLYGGRKFPRYAEGVTFRLTVDLNMQNEKPWIPIGSVFSGSRFSGTFLGDGHIIDNLSLDDDSVYFYRNSNIGGLFGMLSGEVRDLHFTNLTANSTTIVAGAVCALMNGGTIENCIVEGNIETTTSNNNFAISGIGGIAGVSLTAHTQDNTLTCRDTIRNCVNYADIITHVRRGTNIASHSAGGIIGHGGVVIDCANAGDISGGAECGYIGGIGGDLTSALRCFNTGRISIAKSPQSIDYYVGGVVGINGYPHTVQHCYNAGPVDGSDRNHVGGIMGEGAPEYCYLSNTVTSTGKYLGSITASSPNSPNHCYYDNQMSPIGGTNGTDHTSQTEGLTTSDMLGNALQGQLGDNENWEFTEDLYPQLSRLSTLNSQFPTLNSKFSTLSRTSVMPVLLSTDQTWATAHDNFSMGGCDEHHFWKKLRGSVEVNGCNVIPGAHAMGVLEFAATYDSVPYRHITLKYNLDEDHALIIKNAMQFDSMRMVINNANGGFYRFSDNTFHLNIPSGADHNDFIAILDGGNERFFRLISNINLGSTNWIPIGGSEEGCCDLYRGNPFKGTFDGCGYTIRNLDVFWTNDDPFSPAYPNYLGICNRYQGLFGTIEGGTVKNLRFIQNDGNKSISNSAFLCAVNRGTLYNCVIDSCVLTVSSYKQSSTEEAKIMSMDTVSLLCGVNDGGLIDSCRVKNSQIVIDKIKIRTIHYSVIGGVCGLNKQGTIQDCRVENLHFEDLRGTSQSKSGTKAAGGICGINFHGQLLNDTIKNSRFLFSASLDHQNIGGICGINGNDDKDENRYTDIPSIVENCLSDSTIIRCDTCIQGSTCKKMAMNFGGIVGMSQGHIVQINSCSTIAGSRLEVVADSVGGICGRFVGLGDQSLISDCDNYAPVKGYGYVGGIVGVVTNATLKNNHNSGNVWSAWDAYFENNRYKPSGYYAGGIAGACIRRVVVKTCANNAKIKADSSYVGGIAGALLNSCELINCTNNGLGDNEPDVSGINQVGGLVGLFGEDTWFGNGCENHGSVKGIAQVGGLVGYAKEGHLQCEGNNDGTVQGSSMTGCVYGYAEDPSLFEECASNQCQAFPHPQTINTANDLIAVRNAVNDGSNSYEGWTILLNEDLIFNGTDWIPIGTPEHPFCGTFNGQNHSIHFHINAPNSDYQGLFGYMQGTVTNLYLDNCSVIGRNYVGVIAGYCHGTISNCYSYREKVEGEKYVGGLVGMASYSEIQDCFNGNNIVGEQYVGGIVGDFASCKNDNCYGTMKYDLYGG